MLVINVKIISSAMHCGGSLYVDYPRLITVDLQTMAHITI